MAALFATGVSDTVLRQLEAQGGWGQGRPWLVRHHVLARRDDRWHMLPPLARFALDASLSHTAGFDWAACRSAPQALFGSVAQQAKGIASTTEALSARAWLLDEFGTLARLLQHDLDHPSPRLDWMQQTHEALINQYQFRAALSCDLLARLHRHLVRPASALQALGDLERRLGRPDEARGLYDRALALYEKEQAGLGQANALQALGDVQLAAGLHDQAATTYQRALVLYASEQEPMGTAYTFAELARCLHALRQDALRDQALRAALGAAERAHVDHVSAYVARALQEVTGGPNQARAWMACMDQGAS